MRTDSEKTGRMEEDKIYWEALLGGDQEALERIFRRHYASLHQYGYKLVGDIPLVEDSLQELFLYIFENRKKLGKVTFVRAYLFRSFRRSLIRNRRNQQKSMYVSLSDSWKVMPHEIELMEKDEQQRKYLSKLINELSPREREMIYMRYYNDLSPREIAEALLISYRAVINTLYKAMAKLRENRDQLEKLKGL